jgi:hypothetical protein
MGNRKRKARGLRKPPETALDKARAVAKLTHLKGRNVELNLVPSGIEVRAESPEDLERETDKEVVRRAGTREN